MSIGSVCSLWGVQVSQPGKGDETGQCFPYKQQGPRPNLALEVRWCPYGIRILVRATGASPVETAGPKIVLPSARYEALFYS